MYPLKTDQAEEFQGAQDNMDDHKSVIQQAWETSKSNEWLRVVQFNTVQYTIISVLVSKFVNSIKIENCIIPVFWDPSAGVTSTVVQYLKGIPYCTILTCTAQWK